MTQLINEIQTVQDSSLSLKVALVMPVYNEGETIGRTIQEIDQKLLSKMPNASLLIFEDGSKDDTKEVLSNISKLNKRIVTQTSAERKGYPKAVRDAFLSIDENVWEYVLFLDSDGQYDPADFPRLFEALRDGSPDIVMGRRQNRAEPSYRVALSSGLKVIEKVLFSPPCKDVTSAIRLMKTKIAKKIASKVRYSPYNFWLEFTARSTEEGLSVVEVPVNYRAREGEAKSNVYSLNKMPQIVSKELMAILHTWWEYKGVQAIKFAGVGLSGSIVILALSYIFTTVMSQNYLISTGIAIETSIIWAFVLNDTLTFKRSRKGFSILERLGRYNFVSLGGLMINEIVLFALTRYLGFYYLLAEFVAIMITFGFNYFASLKWAWVRAK